MNEVLSKLNSLEVITIVAAAPRPGTDFLHSLLDSHPQIISFDGWLNFHEFFENSISVYGFKKYFFKKNDDRFQNINLSDFFYEFAWSHLHKFDSRYDNIELKGNLGPNKNDHNFIDIDKFVKHAVDLLSTSEFSSKNSLLAIYGAISLTRGEPLANKKVLLHNVHLQDHLDPFLVDFPEAKIIACTRDPRVLSTKIIKTLSEMELSRYSIEMSRALFKLGIDGIDRIISRGPKVFVNPLERLHNSPKEVMTNISNWVEISFEESLLQSSWYGKTWNGDILSDNIESAFDPNRYIESQIAWKQDMYKTESICIELIMRNEMRRNNNFPEFKYKFWFILAPIFILFPVKYEILILKQIFKSNKFNLMIYLLINILYRYYRSYKKLFTTSLNRSNYFSSS